MKYIRVDVTIGSITRGLVVPFPNDFVHSMMAEAIVQLCKASWPTASKITVASAGDVILDVYETVGRSESLGIIAKPEDARLLNASDYGAHYV